MAIEIRGLAKSFGGLVVFDRFDFDIAESKVTAVLGPSGCGKTTLLNIIAGLTVPDAGRVAGNGGRKVGYVFQEPDLLPWKTVAGNIEFVLHGLFSPSECRSLAHKWAGLVGLEAFLTYHPDELSGGMRQRVGIARAFAFPSSMLLLDEPFQGLDVGLRLGLIRLFLEVWKRDLRTTLFVTHEINEALLLADDLCVLSPLPAQIVARYSIETPHADRSPGSGELADIERKLYAILAPENTGG